MRSINWKYQLSVLLGLCFISYAFGRYQSSGSVSTTLTKQSTVASASDSAESKAKATITDHSVTTTTAPSGQVTVTKHDVVTQAQVQIKEVIVTKEVIREVEKTSKKTNPPQWRIGLDAGLTTSGNRLIIPNPSPILAFVPYDFGVHVERRVLGPVWLGGRVTSDKSIGLTLSIEF